MDIINKTGLEEYNKGLDNAAKPNDSFVELQNRMGDNPAVNNKINELFKYFTEVLTPFGSSLSYIIYYRMIPSYLPLLKKHNTLIENYPRLTFEEFYDVLIILPNFIIRKIIGELDCTPSVFEDLLSLISNHQKAETIEKMRLNNVDITTASRIVALLTDSQRFHDFMQSYVQDGNMESKKAKFQKMQLKFFSDITRFNSLQSEALNVQGIMSEVMSRMEMLETANEEEEADIDKEIYKALMTLRDFGNNSIYFYWDDIDSFTLHEREVLDGILKRNMESYNEMRRLYELNKNIEPLDLPSGIFEDELKEIYNKLEKFCPRGQNFTALFGYGEASSVVWTGDWNTLAYF